MKLIKILTISICIIILLSNSTFAVSEIFDTGEDWITTGRGHAGIGMDTDNLSEGSEDLYFFLLAIATVIAVIVGAILGLRYMTAGIEEKVQVKESLFPYLISCVVVFGSLGIWKLVVTIMSELI